MCCTSRCRKCRSSSDAPPRSARVDETGFAARLAGAARRSARRLSPAVARLSNSRSRAAVPGFRDAATGRGTARARSLSARFVAAGGRLLQLHALFDALDRHFRATLGAASGWLRWPRRFRDPEGARGGALRPGECPRSRVPSVSAMARARAARRGAGVWRASSACRSACTAIMPWALIRAARRPGWIRPPIVWAPRSARRPIRWRCKGQGWGIPPQDPVDHGSAAPARVSAAHGDNMRYYGALRLDHVMSLFRLWWVPAGTFAHRGRLRALSAAISCSPCSRSRARAILPGGRARISAWCRTRCAAAMPLFGLYHYKVVLFEKEAGDSAGRGNSARGRSPR